MTSSFIICTKDRYDDLKTCLVSIMEQTILPHEVIIVDASDDDISFKNLKNCESVVGDKIKLIYMRSEPSTTRQRNIGIENANGDIVFFLDDDVILEEDYHEKILEVYKLKNNEKLGGVRGSYATYHKPKSLEVFYRKIFFMYVTQLKGKSRVFPSLNYIDVLEPDTIIKVESMPSCICSYYRKVFDEFRFDETMDKYALSEDLDLSYSVSRKYNLYQTPYARLVHNMSPVSRVSMREYRRLQITNLHYLAKKHIPAGNIKWLAFYWSLVGYLIYSVIQYSLYSNSDDLLGFLDGIKSIVMSNNKSTFNNY